MKLFILLLTSSLYCLSPKEERLIEHVQYCLHQAENLTSKITSEVAHIHGFSSPHIRHFLNNLCTLPETHYLEVGCWKGSTFIPALYSNESTVKEAFAVENWSQFEGTKEAFMANVNTYIPLFPIRLCETDCFSLDKAKTFTAPINIFFYDGAHDADSQARAFTYFKEVLDDVFIALVDDWNWSDVRTGTFRGLKKGKFKVLFERQIFTNGNGDPDSWWNGFYIAVVRKGH